MSFQEKQIGIRNVTFGENVTIVQPVNLYECNIGNHVFIGPFVEIQKGVQIGDQTRINHIVLSVKAYPLASTVL